jgi:hypothetical protein
MFMSFFADKSRPMLGLVGTAWGATVHPTRTGQSIVIGSREDFDRRVTFFLSVAGLQLVIQTLVAAALGVSVMPSSFDSLWQFVQPFFAALLFLFLYIPIRLFRWTKLKFSEYFQAAAMSVGPGLFLVPFSLLPAILIVHNYGKPSVDDPRVQSIMMQPGAETLGYCSPSFDSLLCLGMLGGVAPETAWTATLNMIMSFVLIVPIFMIIKAGTGISLWKQVVSFIVVVIAMVISVVAYQMHALA